MSDSIYRTPPCPLHFGLGFKLDCPNCRSMPTIMPDGGLRNSMWGATTDELRRWAQVRDREVKGGKSS